MELQFSAHALQNALDWATGAYYLDSEDFNSGIVDNSSNVGGPTLSDVRKVF